MAGNYDFVFKDKFNYIETLINALKSTEVWKKADYKCVDYDEGIKLILIGFYTIKRDVHRSFLLEMAEVLQSQVT